MYRRVLLCIPPVEGYKPGWPDTPHVGIGYLSEFLTKHAVEHKVLDMRFGYSIPDLQREIDKFHPDLVGISMFTPEYEMQYQIVEAIKSPKHRIIVGGPHVSSLGEKILAECSADFAVLQEGEYPLWELCQGVPPEEIPNLIYRKNGQVLVNPSRPYVRDLDVFPFPKYEKFPLELYGHAAMPIITSRGCPYKCNFCAVMAVTGRTFRVRSAQSIVTEILYWYQRGYRRFEIQDDNFTLNKKRVERIIDLLESAKMKGVSIWCDNGIRADRVDRNLLQRMKQVGFDYVAFGVESGNDRILERIQKGEDMATIDRAVRDACDVGMDVGLFFIIGHPEETPEDVEDTFRFALKYPVEEVFFYPAAPFPGTELYDWVEANGYSFGDLQQRYQLLGKYIAEPFFATPEFSYEERKTALIRAQSIRREVEDRHYERRLRQFSPARRVFMRRLHMLGRVVNYHSVWSWLLFHVRIKVAQRFLVSFARRFS